MYIFDRMSKEKHWQVSEESEWDALIPEILEFCLPIKKWKLKGEMGAGKTSFVKALGRKLGIEGVSSPTFPIVNEYELPIAYRKRVGELIYHIDLYRLDDPEELIGIGLSDYLMDPNLAIVEWPDISDDLWPETFAELRISEAENGNRELLIILHIAE